MSILAPRVWFEQTTYRLTAGCSTAELTRNTLFFKSIDIISNTKYVVNHFLKIYKFFFATNKPANFSYKTYYFLLFNFVYTEITLC